MRQSLGVPNVGNTNQWAGGCSVTVPPVPASTHRQGTQLALTNTGNSCGNFCARLQVLRDLPSRTEMPAEFALIRISVYVLCSVSLEQCSQPAGLNPFGG